MKEFYASWNYYKLIVMPRVSMKLYIQIYIYMQQDIYIYTQINKNIYFIAWVSQRWVDAVGNSVI